MPERVTIDWADLADLDLDPDNPRHEPGMSRRDIIRYLVDKESVLGLARDIAKVGLSPLDMFGAIAAPEGGYVILEGNRRLCALILLHDPTLAPPKERKIFERLSRDLDPDEIVIELTVFDDEDEADVWIDRKHAGPGNGNGPKPWNPVQLARRYGDRTGNALALALLEYGQSHGMLTKAQSTDILTTITRFISNPFVRKHGLGITTSASEPEFKILGTQSLFDLRLQRLLSDIVARANGATSRTNSADRAKYAQENLVNITEPVGPTPDDAEESADDTEPSAGSGEKTADNGDDAASDEPSADDGADDSEGSSTSGSGTHPDKRLKLVPEAFAPSLRDERLKRILAELKSVRRFSPLAAALIVRVFLESVTVKYLETRGTQIGQNDKLHLLVHNVLTHIEKEKKSGAIHLTKAEAGALGLLKGQVSNQTYVYSAFYLGLIAHGSAFPDWATLTKKWDEVEPILGFIASNAEPPIEPAQA
ncbi:hypothetical protein ACLD0U_07310 [Microbacterium sp. 2216-1]|uniref:hypothetical protein n=1 Tax=Microbacterium sp. 2216-1 TaxID=3390053 RepID=UPI0039754DF8